MHIHRLFASLVLSAGIVSTAHAQDPPLQGDFYILNAHGGPDHALHGAALTFEEDGDHADAVIRHERPTKWRFEKIQGRPRTYSITAAVSGSLSGASLSWDSAGNQANVTVDGDDPVEWKVVPVASKPGTFRIINVWGEKDHEYYGHELSWTERDGADPTARIKEKGAVVWRIARVAGRSGGGTPAPPAPPKITEAPGLRGAFHITNTWGGPDHPWFGAQLSFDGEGAGANVTVEHDDPMTWLFTPVAGKPNVYRIESGYGGESHPLYGASLSWKSAGDHANAVIDRNDPVEWKVIPVEGKNGTFRILNQYGSASSRYFGDDLSWKETDGHASAVVRTGNPVEWRISKKPPPKRKAPPKTSNALSGDFFVMNTHGGPSHEWYGATLSFDTTEAGAEVTVEQFDPMKWRFVPIDGKPNVYGILSAYGDASHALFGASLSWKSDDEGANVVIDRNDPVEWKVVAVEGKPETYRIYNQYADASHSLFGHELSWSRGSGSHPSARLKSNDPVEWRISRTQDLQSQRKVVILYEDDNGWNGRGDRWQVGTGSYSHKGRGGHPDLPFPNDEVRALDVPAGLTVYMTDDDSFRHGSHGTLKVVGPARVNIKDRQNKLAGKVSSLSVSDS